MIRRARLFALIPVLSVANAMAARLNIDLQGTSIPVEVTAGYTHATLTVSGPRDELVQQSLGSNTDRFKLNAALPNGQYRYRIDLTSGITETRAGMGPDGRASAAALRAVIAPAEGTFRIEGGHVFTAVNPPSRLDSEPTPNNVVTADNAIIQGSMCVGLDCSSTETFGFDTIRLKENNTRILFMDTSASPGFANTNWQLTANDSVSGGLNKFSIEDITAATVPITVLGAAPNDSIYVASNGKVGLRTSTPALDLHFNTSDTPAIRLEQNNGGGFTAQTWDVAGNEANFFVRDLTGGSRLPLRIRPGAPTSSVDIAATGAVGFGTASPGARVDILYNTSLTSPATVLRILNQDGSVDAAQQDRFVVDSAGNVLARGTLSQLSSRSAKENFATTDGHLMLAKLEQMPVSSWNYRGAPAQERHIGPVAEDFHAAFGLGASNRYIAPADMAGVALASVKALQEEVKDRDQKIDQLEQRLRALEARLDATR